MFKSIIIALIIAITSSAATAGGSLKFDIKGVNNFGGKANIQASKITLTQQKKINKDLVVSFTNINSIKLKDGSSSKVLNTTLLGLSYKAFDTTFTGQYHTQTQNHTYSASRVDFGVKTKVIYSEAKNSISWSAKKTIKW